MDNEQFKKFCQDYIYARGCNFHVIVALIDSAEEIVLLDTADGSQEQVRRGELRAIIEEVYDNSFDRQMM